MYDVGLPCGPRHGVDKRGPVSQESSWDQWLHSEMTLGLASYFNWFKCLTVLSVCVAVYHRLDTRARLIQILKIKSRN